MTILTRYEFFRLIVAVVTVPFVSILPPITKLHLATVYWKKRGLDVLREKLRFQRTGVWVDSGPRVFYYNRKALDHLRGVFGIDGEDQ